MINDVFNRPFNSEPSQTGKKLGFRYGDKGTHSSRTIMFEELQQLLESHPGNVSREIYIQAVIDENCLGKHTAATRKLSLQRLSELYGLDPDVPLFRIMCSLWAVN